MQLTSSTSGSRYGNLVRSVAFLLGLAVLLGITQFVLTPRYDRDDLWTTYRELPEGSVDVLFFGTSMIHANVNPTVIWETSGIRSYVLSGSAQSLALTPWYLEEALKTQHPRVVVLDVRGLLNESHEQTERQKRVNYTMMPAGVSKLRAMVADLPPQEWTRYWVPLEQFHSRWIELGRGDFNPLKHCGKRPDSFFGYRLVDRVEAQQVSRSRKSFDADIYDENYRLTSQFIETASGAGAQVLLLVSPTSQPDFYAEWLPRLEADIARDYPNVSLLSAQDRVEEIGLSYESHYYDASHLNRLGAERYSTWLVGELRERYGSATETSEAWEAVWQRESARYTAAVGANEKP